MGEQSNRIENAAGKSARDDKSDLQLIAFARFLGRQAAREAFAQRQVSSDDGEQDG